jgi:sec-independent protein translocase protein TatA
MGLDNPLHIAFLVVILLLVFGAKRLPEIGRSLGSGMREFKQSITGESTPQQPALAPPQQPGAQQAPAQQAPAQAAPTQTTQPPPAAQPAAAAFGEPVGAQVGATPPVAEQAPAGDEQRS